MSYEFRTKSAQSGGLEKNGRRERVFGTRPVRRSPACEGPCLSGISAGSQASGEYWMGTGLAERVGFEPTVRFFNGLLEAYAYDDVPLA
jgi:hypothetical protein